MQLPFHDQYVHDEPRTAESVLLRTLIGQKGAEGRRLLLHAFQRDHRAAIASRGQHRAGKHAFAI